MKRQPKMPVPHYHPCRHRIDYGKPSPSGHGGHVESSGSGHSPSRKRIHLNFSEQAKYLNRKERYRRAIEEDLES